RPGRDAGDPIGQIRARDQSEDRQSARPQRAAIAAVNRRGHRVRRRELIAAIGGAVITRPVLAADAAKPARVGVLAPAPLRPIDSLKQRLHERGWIEGRNVQFEFRWADNDDTRYPAL